MTRNPEVLCDQPRLRDMRVSVGTFVGLLAAGHPNSEIRAAYPYLDIRQALAYVA